jgi:3-deoxy-manno-octulosonate cytidylyltransferase (CMP-KDO synthetase)
VKVAVVIPARLSAKRFPRKVLARETGKYLVQHVWERVVGCPGVDRTIIATDSTEVEEACRSFEADVVLTSEKHVSGTDRVAEVALRLPHDVIVNVQADEPLIEHRDLTALVELLTDDVVMTTLAVRRSDPEGFRDPNIVKVVVGESGNALYFSRAPVPSTPAEPAEWFHHLGMYGYHREFLLDYSKMPATAVEQRERLEQLRALENGFKIRVGLSPHRHLGIDTAEEYRAFVAEYLAAR